jgi:hypothetical protein
MSSVIGGAGSIGEVWAIHNHSGRPPTPSRQACCNGLCSDAPAEAPLQAALVGLSAVLPLLAIPFHGAACVGLPGASAAVVIGVCPSGAASTSGNGFPAYLSTPWVPGWRLREGFPAWLPRPDRLMSIVRVQIVGGHYRGGYNPSACSYSQRGKLWAAWMAPIGLLVLDRPGGPRASINGPIPRRPSIHGVSLPVRHPCRQTGLGPGGSRQRRQEMPTRPPKLSRTWHNLPSAYQSDSKAAHPFPQASRRADDRHSRRHFRHSIALRGIP